MSNHIISLVFFFPIFSEPAISAVIVNCFASSESSAIANSLQLGFTQATVLPQQTQTTVYFLFGVQTL